MAKVMYGKEIKQNVLLSYAQEREKEHIGTAFDYKAMQSLQQKEEQKELLLGLLVIQNQQGKSSRFQNSK